MAFALKLQNFRMKARARRVAKGQATGRLLLLSGGVSTTFDVALKVINNLADVLFAVLQLA